LLGLCDLRDLEIDVHVERRLGAELERPARSKLRRAGDVGAGARFIEPRNVRADGEADGRHLGRLPKIEFERRTGTRFLDDARSGQRHRLCLACFSARSVEGAPEVRARDRLPAG
jgi:hypothetical protein